MKNLRIDLNKFGKNVKNLRESNGYSQNELIEIINGKYSSAKWNKSTLSRWENGKCMMDMTNAVIFCDYFGVPFDELVELVSN